MNLVLLDSDELGGTSRVELTGRRARHLREVVRVKTGDQVRVGIVRGSRGRAKVLSVDRESVVLEVALDEEDVPPPPTVQLILALPRPKVLARTLRDAASVGVRRIDLVNAWRVDKAYFESSRLEPRALAREALLGCEQGGTTWLPEVEVHRLLMPFLDALEDRLAAEEVPSRRILAHPRAELLLEDALPPGDDAPAVLAIGPEGGWIEREVASFEALGFRAVSLGPHLLRVESAVSVMLAEVDLLRRLRGRQ